MSVTFRHYPGGSSIKYMKKYCYIRSVIYGKKGNWILLKGDGMVTEWHRILTEWSLKCTCHSVDWMVTERWLNGAFQFSLNGGVSSCVNLQTKSNLTTLQDFNAGANVILDLTPYSDLVFGKTINEMVS